MAVLSDGEMIVGDGSTDPVAESGATLRTSIGVGTGDDVLFAAISAIVVQLWFNDSTLSLIISISMILNMIVAGLFGILVPVSLKKMNIDPAIASSVFVTTITDVIGFLSFLGVGAYFFY